MTALRFAYKVASLGTSAWLGWKLATLEARLDDSDEIQVCEVDAMDALIKRVHLLEVAS